MNDTSGLILVTGSNGRIGSALMQRCLTKELSADFMRRL